MAIFNKTQINQSYSEKLDSAKALFKGAYNDAVALHAEISEEIASVENKLSELRSVEYETKKFISNLEGLV